MSHVLAFEDVHFCYPGQDSAALCGASLAIPAGCRMALIGRNGSGKSTLLLHGNGVLRPAQGRVLLAGRPITYDQRGLLQLRRQVGVVFQNPDDQLFSASVAQDISFGPVNLGLAEAEIRERVAQVADLCGLTRLLDRPTHALSGGEKARVALAGVLAMQPQLLLMDEVVAGLDPWMRRQLFQVFHQVSNQGVTLVLSTHDLQIAQRWADLVVVMHAGQVVAVAPPAQIFADRLLWPYIGPEEEIEEFVCQV